MTLAVQTGHEPGPYHGLRSPMNDDDVEIERLLSQKLLEGYVLMERSCPACATPLVKNHVGDDEDDAGRELAPFVVPSQSFDQPFRPVNGVPFCVSCQAHVVTDESEISILEQCDSLKAKGQILISLQSYTSEVQEEQHDDVDDEIIHVGSGGEATRLAKNGYDATSLLCGTTASRQMVVQTPEPHPHDQGLEVEHEKAMFAYNSYVEMEAAKKEAPKSPQFHSDEKKDDDDHHYHRTAAEETPQTSEGDKSEQGIEEYSVRREIATKVLGAKMLQGYTLKETQCEKCGMPMMEYNDVLDCVVCPALIKKAKKKLKEQHRLAEQKARMDQAIQMAKEQKALELAEVQLAAANAEQALDDTETLCTEDEAKWLIVQAQEDEAARIAELEAEEKRLLAEARSRAEDEARIRAQEEEARILEDMKYGSHSVEQSNSGSKVTEEELRRTEELAIVAETMRLERMENDRAASKMRQDFLLQEERKLMANRSQRDIEIQRMEKLRMEELLEQKLQDEERRMQEEAELLMSLEQEASEKARAAEVAIEKAKIALASVSSARKDIIAQTIALAEAEAIAEAEGIIMAEREDYKSPIVLPTQEDLMREYWETLRQEGRSIMTRRVMAGWTLLPEFCRGKECEHSPLVALEDKKECVICGGSGNGMDGAYLNKTNGNNEEDDGREEDHDAELEQICDESTIPTQYTPYTQYTTSRSFTTTPAHDHEALTMAAEARALASPTANRTVQELHDDFEAKRNMVSKEIGKRMIQGWTLLDMSCPHCVMPLMSDTDGHGEICVLCGLISRIVEPEHSTEQSKDSAADDYQNITRDGSREDGSQDAIGSDDDTPTTNHIEPTTTDHIEPTDIPSEPTSSDNQEVILQSLSTSRSKEEGSLSDQIRKYSQTPKVDPPGPTAKAQKRVSTDPDDTSFKPDAIQGHVYHESHENHESIEVSRDDDISIARTNDEVVTISFPKDFDFSDEKAFLTVMAAKQREFAPKAKAGFSPDVISVPVMTTIPASAEIITVDDAMTQEAMASMFSESAEGLKASELIESGNMDEVVDLAESFMRKNFGSEPVTGLTEKELVTEIVQKFTTSTYRDDEVKEIPTPRQTVQKFTTSTYRDDEVKAIPTTDEIELCRSPMERSAKTPSKSSFNFVDLPRRLSSNDVVEQNDNVSTNSQISSLRRPRITPESMNTRVRSKKEAVEAPGSRGAPFPGAMQSAPRAVPPRPDSSARSQRSNGSRYSRPPLTSVGRRRKNQSPRNGGVLVIGGPSEGDHEMDNVSLGEVSRAETVATQTLDSLLTRIEECKSILLDPRSDHVKQAETARLIEQLASAAMAVKKLEAMAF